MKWIRHLESKLWYFSLWLHSPILPVLSLIYNNLLFCNLSALTATGHLIRWPLPFLPSNHPLSSWLYFLLYNPAPPGFPYPSCSGLPNLCLLLRLLCSTSRIYFLLSTKCLNLGAPSEPQTHYLIPQKYTSWNSISLISMPKTLGLRLFFSPSLNI